jgi:hypothetical protein
MVLGPPVEIPGDVAELVLQPLASGFTAVRIGSADGRSDRRFDGRALPPAVAGPAPVSGALRVTASGVERAAVDIQAPCPYQARDVIQPSGPPTVQIRRPGSRAFLLDAPFGAGLRGLAFP